MPTLTCSYAGIYGCVETVNKIEDAHFLQHFYRCIAQKDLFLHFSKTS